MSGCSCEIAAEQQRTSPWTLRVALALNAAMFVVGMAAGIAGQSSGLIADALDMLADASAYAIALTASSRGDRFKAKAARASGTLLLILGVGVILDAIRRGFFGSAPESVVMIAIASVSLCVNATVLYLLGRLGSKEVHLRATYIFTRADVVANIAVIVSGAVLMFTHFRYLDLIVGCGIGLYVVHEAREILEEAREAGKASED